VAKEEGIEAMKKRALLVVLLAIVLATAGVAYAAWTSTLNVSAVVKTGFADMKWTALYAENNGGGYGTCVPGYADGDRTFTLTVNDAYPGFRCETWSTHQNVGSVPLKAQSIETTVLLGGGYWVPPVGTWTTLAGHSCGQLLNPGDSYPTHNVFTVPNSVSENATVEVYQHINFVAAGAYSGDACSVTFNGITTITNW
jgi:hypothetical protein